MVPQSRLPIFIALVGALFLRVMVPTGWMPSPAGGPFAIQPCPGAEAPAHHMAGQHGGKPQHDSGHDPDCAFSPLLTGFAPAGSAAQIAPEALAAAVPYAWTAAPTLKTGPPALPPPATGPPTIA